MSFVLALVVAAASGFIALSYEILWYRVIAFASWGLPSAFGLLLAAYLFGLAVGSRIAGALCKEERGPSTLRVLAAFAFFANLVAWLVVPVFAWSSQRWEWPPALAFVALSAALLGAILPLVAHFGIEADDRAGVNLSYVYLANIVGSAAGSLITGFVFLDTWSIQTIGAVIAGLGMLLVALIVGLAPIPSGRRAGVLGALALVSIALVRMTPGTYDRIWERLLYKQNFTETARFADVIENKSGVITVTQDGTVYGGGAYDGRFNTSLRWDRNGIMRAFAVGALHPAPKRILMVGLASGSWANVIAGMPGLEKLTIVEINPGYVELIGKHAEVSGILKDPKVEIVIDDGRRWLHRNSGSDAMFDVIVMNTTWHWRAHITNLLSTEFMQLARAHMNPGGIFFFNTTSSADVQKTAATVFPHAMRVYNFMAVSDAELVFDRDRWHRTLTTHQIYGDKSIDLGDEDGQKLLAELMTYPDSLREAPIESGLESRESVLARTTTASLVTDDNMVPEWRQVFQFKEPPPKP